MLTLRAANVCADEHQEQRMKNARRRNKLPTDAMELQIQRLSHDGRGIASIEGKIAFVDGALTGETVKALYVARHKQYDELRAQEILVSASERVQPMPACVEAVRCSICIPMRRCC